MSNHILQIAINSPLRQLFNYRASSEPAVSGSRVAVTFGHQSKVMGIIADTEIHGEFTEKKLRSIQHTLDKTPSLDHELMSLCQWCADYYHFPLGEVCHLALPALLRKPEPEPAPEELWVWQLTEKGRAVDDKSLEKAPKQQQLWQLLNTHSQLTKNELKRHSIQSTTLKTLEKKGWISRVIVEKPLSSHTELLRQPPLTLNQEQQTALAAIRYQQFSTYLLNGVTGSGKTEVYLQAIQQVLQKAQQVLVLVPEIGLTPQTLARFENRFNVPTAVLHSGLTNKQRLHLWQQARRGLLPIVIGTRSAIFTQFPDLGLIIVDEEHDLSYKQQEGVRYSARDLAIVRAQQKNIPLILGSATPSLESLHNALNGRYDHLPLQQRAKQTPLPKIALVEGDENTLQDETLSAIKETLQTGQQVLLFINRRGFAPTLLCADCHWMAQCHHCDSRMTLHRNTNQQQLHCHQCDYRSDVPQQCPHCHSRRLQALGSGTQRSEQSLETLFPNVPIIRIDRDSTARKGMLEQALNTIHQGDPCILIGTQMLAKGHHFANLGLAVLLGIDQGFFSSDFRGAERMGQLITQVAGRVGREQQHSRVIIQTRFTDHPLFQPLIQHRYQDFAEQLLAERQLTGMPPFEHLAVIRCHAQSPQLAQQFLQQARQQAQRIAPPHSGLQYLGPFPASMEKRNNRYHFLLQIKAVNRRERQQLLQPLCAVLEKMKQPKGLHWLVDVDTQEF